jgi:hypothetical protein
LKSFKCNLSLALRELLEGNVYQYKFICEHRSVYIFWHIVHSSMHTNWHIVHCSMNSLCYTPQCSMYTFWHNVNCTI